MSHGPFRTTTYHEMEHGGEPWPDKSGSPPENCQVFLRDAELVDSPAHAVFLLCVAAHFTSTFTRIHGWMQHSKRCSPFDKPVTCSWLPCRIRVLATARFLNPPEHSGAMASPPLRSSIKPPPNCATSVKV